MSGGHPLFPPKDGQKTPPEVAWIRVERYGADGVRSCPRRFGGDDLRDWSQVYELFGGGKYQLVAHRDNGQVSARVSMALDGRSRPLTLDEPEPEPGQPQPVAVPQGQGGSLLPWVSALAPMVMAFLRAQGEARQADAARHNEMMMLLMKSMSENSAAHVQSMQSLHDRSLQQTTQLLSARGGGNGEDWQRGAQWMQEFMAGQLEGAREQGDDSLVDTIQQAMQAFTMFQQAKAQGEAPPGTMPPGMQPPGMPGGDADE